MLFHTLSQASNFPLFFCHSQFCKSYLVRKRTHRLILKAFGMLKHFPAGCIIYSPPPPPLPKPASFLRHKTQHKGTRQPKGSDGRFSGRAIVSPVSLLPPRLHAPDYQYKAMHGSVNAQKPKATHRAAPASVLKSSWALAKVQPPHPFPWACFESLQRTAEPGTGSTTTSSLLCSGLPSCGPHSYRKA